MKLAPFDVILQMWHDLLNKLVNDCNENYIIQYYNPQRATYSKGKNGLRTFIMSNYYLGWLY